MNALEIICLVLYQIALISLGFALGYNIHKKENNTFKEHDEEKANKYNCKNCMHYGNIEAFFGEVYACELYECHFRRKESWN